MARQCRGIAYQPLAPLITAAVLSVCPFVARAQSLPVAISPTRLEFTAAPGETLTGSLKFWNGSDVLLPIHLEASDVAQQDEEGHAQVGGESAANSLAAWVMPALSDLAVAPKEQITLDFSIDVPVNADPGTHWGALLVITAPQEQARGAAVQTRTGVILLVRVLGDVTEKLALESFGLPRFVEAPPIALEARFRNEGTVHEAPEGMIEVRNMFGSLVATGTLPVRNVLPDAVRKVSTTVGSGTWFGRYAVTLRATYGDTGETLLASAYVWVVPWKTYGPWVFGIIAILAAILLEPKRALLAFRILITGKSPDAGSVEGTRATDQTS